MSLLALIFLTSVARAQLVEISLPAPNPKPSSIVFRKMKEQEDRSQWLECARSGRSGFIKAGIVKGWILRSWVKCAYLSDRSDEVLHALRAWGRGTGFRDGPWEADLVNEVVRARLWVAEKTLKSNRALAGEQLAALFEEIPAKDKASRARAWALAGELAQVKHDLNGAAVAFEQSLKEQDDRAVQDKYNSVLLALSQSRPQTGGKGGGGTPAALSDTEKEFEERFKSSTQANDLMVLLEDCVSYLNNLPNGLKAKWAANKILDVHQTVWDRLAERNPAEKWKLVHGRLISSLEKMDHQRLLNWLPIFYRRGDYQTTLRLADRIRGTLGATVAGGHVAWYGGRASQLLGESKKAEKYFTQYLDLHGGAEMARDVQFHLALIYLRNRNPSSAIATLERLLQSGAPSSLELTARYWMVRALQATKNPRAIDESRKVVENFPFSYYGIRLRSEMQNGTFEWPYPAAKPLKALKGKLYLNSVQKKAWDRMRWLHANGWPIEAQIEARQISRPEDPVTKVLVAQELAKVAAYPTVIRLVNDAGDQSPEFRSVDVVRLGLPQVFHDIISKEAKKRSLSPILVRSLIRQESAFFTRAVSRSNALGLMQLIPPTAKEVAQDLKLTSLEVPDDVFSPPTNIQLGTAYLAKMLRQFMGSVPVALASYNAGPRRIETFLRARPEVRTQALKASSDPWDEMWIDELPWAETTYYVKAILRNTILYKTLESRKVSLQGVLWQDLVLGPNSKSEKTEVN